MTAMLFSFPSFIGPISNSISVLNKASRCPYFHSPTLNLANASIGGLFITLDTLYRLSPFVGFAPIHLITNTFPAQVAIGSQ